MKKQHIFFTLLCAGIAVAIMLYQNNTFITAVTQNKTDPVSCSVRHLGLIMDGNRRWAKRNGLKPWLGHKKGVEPVKESIEFCLKNNIRYLTLYAFSLENFKRSPEELQYLFDILAKEIASTELENLFKEGVKVRFVGDKTQFPQQLHETIAHVEKTTIENNKLYLDILFCYGGQQEIIAATKKIAAQIAAGTITSNDITQELFEQSLWTQGAPAPDLIVRTGGAHRLSNFLPYQSAYSEILFLDCYWPDLTKKDLTRALEIFEKTHRNFGA